VNQPLLLLLLCSVRLRHMAIHLWSTAQQQQHQSALPLTQHDQHNTAPTVQMQVQPDAVQSSAMTFCCTDDPITIQTAAAAAAAAQVKVTSCAQVLLALTATNLLLLLSLLLVEMLLKTLLTSPFCLLLLLPLLLLLLLLLTHVEVACGCGYPDSQPI
jgi:hypothetical protein